MQKLPIGIQSFRQIREENYIYIDKTALALELIKNYKYSFLSRPRRFGKSLFLDTLRHIFEGKKELFEGLAIYDKWNWQESYPIIKLSWGGSDYSSMEETKKKALFMLEINQKKLQIDCKLDDSPSICLARLIHNAYEKYQKKVVVLVDEYDKPILNNIDNTKLALENRDFLRGFYEVFKENDEYLEFVFLTGISKFSKANIFSGLNNLEDISLTPKFSTICGYTQENLEDEFKEHLAGANLEQVRQWYNGYNFLGESVYNPFDILKFIKSGFLFRNYWWESGNPSFLITLLKQKPYNIPELENIIVGDELLNSFDIEQLRLEVLLFQSGYLTIDKFINDPEFGINEYKLKVPNKEVNISLNRLFLDYLTDGIKVDKRVIYALLEANLEEFKDIFSSLFASIAYNNYTKNKIANYEGYYASVFYAYLAASGLNVIAEDVTSSGKIDITILIKDKAYIIEFKVGKKGALAQIKAKQYYKKYLKRVKEIYLLGIVFDKESKNISDFVWERVE